MGMWLLRVIGRNEEAVGRLRLALRADPLPDLIRLHLGFALIASGQYDEAAAICTNVTSNDGTRNQCLARASLWRGDLKQAIAQMETAADRSRNPQARGFLRYMYAKAGRQAEVEKLASESQFPNERALLFAGLGDKERTIHALDGMKVLGAQRLGIYLHNPEFAFVRTDPRVQALRASVGLPQ
jgi:tetratricopeptide (TPR) repeat protein